MPIGLSIKTAPDALVQRRRQQAERRHRSMRVSAIVLACAIFSQQVMAKGVLTYDDIAGLSIVLNTMPQQQRDKLIVTQRLQQLGICDWGCEELKVWVTARGQRVSVPLGHGVILAWSPDPAVLGQNLPLQSNSPLPLGLDADIRITPPKTVVVPVAYFLDALRQVNRLAYRFALHGRGFIRALLTWEVNALDVYFAASGAVATLEDGNRTTPLPDDHPGQDQILLRRSFSSNT